MTVLTTVCLFCFVWRLWPFNIEPSNKNNSEDKAKITQAQGKCPNCRHSLPKNGAIIHACVKHLSEALPILQSLSVEDQIIVKNICKRSKCTCSPTTFHHRKMFTDVGRMMHVILGQCWKPEAERTVSLFFFFCEHELVLHFVCFVCVWCGFVLFFPPFHFHFLHLNFICAFFIC